jgi:hypothetical protein
MENFKLLSWGNGSYLYSFNNNPMPILKGWLFCDEITYSKQVELWHNKTYNK